MRRVILIQTVAIGCALLLALLGHIARAVPTASPAAATWQDHGATLAWSEEYDADTVLVQRCRPAQRCALVDVLPTTPGQRHTLEDADGRPGDTYWVTSYRARAGGLNFVAKDGPYTVWAAVALPTVNR